MTHDIHCLIVLGTRPEIIKLAPVIRACERRSISLTIVHTGQHYSDTLNVVFFEKLEIRNPDYNIAVGSKSHGHQTGEMIMDLEDILLEEDPDVVLVQGDTNSVLAGAIAASKLDTSLAHIEAGLRSFDRMMPEEVNRRLTDHTSDYLLAPTNHAAQQLLSEDVDESRISVTGNTVVDAVFQHIEIAQNKSLILRDLELTPDQYGLVTVHRASNVDSVATFQDILDGLNRVANNLGIQLVYPIHPRARNCLDTGDISVPSSINIIDPLDYLDFLKAERNAHIILTDSGGVQEEACVLGVPCVTLRENTERPETIEVGANRLVGTDPDRIEAGAVEMAATDGDWENPFGDGTAGETIVDFILEQEQTSDS